MLAERNLGIDEEATSHGVLYACFGCGGLLGALAVGTVLSRVSRARTAQVALVGFAAALTVFALLRTPAPAYPVAVLVGFGYFAFITSLSTVLQEQLGDHERGRVMALWIMGFGGVVPFGGLAGGWLMEQASIDLVVVAGAVIALVLAAAFDLRPGPDDPAVPASG